MNKVPKFVFLLILLLTSCMPSTVSDQIDTPLTTTEVDRPIPQDGFGVVIGTLELRNERDRVGLIIYLGDIFVDASGYTGGFLDIEKAPVAKFYPTNGAFVFTDVEPGIYSLIVYEVVLGGRAYTDVEGNIVSIKVQNGEITDLGKISITP